MKKEILEVQSDSDLLTEHNWIREELNKVKLKSNARKRELRRVNNVIRKLSLEVESLQSENRYLRNLLSPDEVEFTDTITSGGVEEVL